jgi:hypothetical protein
MLIRCQLRSPPYAGARDALARAGSRGNNQAAPHAATRVLTGLIALIVVVAAASAAGAPDGSITRRASGQQRKADVLAAVSTVLDGGTP